MILKLGGRTVWPRYKLPIIATAIAILACYLGFLLLPVSLQASVNTTASLEPETGSLSGVTQVSDAAASGQSAVKFGSTSFNHPGVLFNKSQLDFMKTKVNANEEPWLSDYNKALANWRGSDSFPVDAGVRAIVECGSHSIPDNGCSDITNAAQAVYVQTILWYITGQSKYATKARAIVNNWSAVLQEFTNDNANFMAAWTAEYMVPSVEILRYTPGSGWTQDDTDQFNAMLTRAYLPQVDSFWNGGGANRVMSLADAQMSIAVFQDDRAMFNRAVTRWRQQVPSIIYMSSDTNDDYINLKDKGYPIPPPDWYKTKSTVTTAQMDTYWRGATSYVSGLEGETCRDMDHTTMGFEAMMHAAQTAYLQSIDLYSEQQDRIVTGLEFNTRYMAQQLTTGSVPSWLCGGTIANQAVPVYQAGWELAYAHYHDVLGVNLPHTKSFIDTYVRTSSSSQMFMVFSAMPTLSFARSN